MNNAIVAFTFRKVVVPGFLMLGIFGLWRDNYPPKFQMALPWIGLAVGALCAILSLAGILHVANGLDEKNDDKVAQGLSMVTSFATSSFVFQTLAILAFAFT